MRVQIRWPQNWLYVLVGVPLFFSMLFIPASYQLLKGALLVMLLGGIAYGVARRHIVFALHPLVLRWVAILVATGVVFMLWGYWNGAPGALRVGTVYVLWPLVFTAFIAVIPSMQMLRTLLGVMTAAGIALGLYGAMFLAHATSVLPASMYIELDQGQAIGLYDGFVEYNMYSISTLFFLLPFFFAALLFWHDEATQSARRWLWLAYGLCFALAILSGRRALWLILAMMPIVYGLFVLPLARRRWPPRLLWQGWGSVILSSAGVFLTLKMLFDLSPERMFAFLLSGFPAGDPGGDPAGDPGASLRSLQAVALLRGWLASPWSGHGHGAVADVIRSETMPWAYELQYLAMLFHTGIVGTLLYAGCIGWVYWQGLRAIRTSPAHGRILLPLLVGLTCFLIANATNPYLLKFDFMWTVFLPLAVINRFLLEDGANEAPPTSTTRRSMKLLGQRSARNEFHAERLAP